MKGLSPYLTFDGNCREALTFYHNALGGELKMMTFGEAPGEQNPAMKDLIMHGHVVKNGVVLMASDNMPGQKIIFGTSVTVSLACNSKEETDTYFKNLSVGANITMPLQNTFWGAYFGMLTDKFGIHWMLSFE